MTERLFEEAERRGLISAAQREQLAHLDRELRTGAGPGEVEARGGFNWVNAAYLIGALLVLFAFAWFLVARWASLGAAGVLAVTAVYGALFVFAGRWLARRGFPRAANAASVLTVGLTPLATWALLSLAGEWPPLDPRDPLLLSDSYMSTRWLVVDLATILAGLLVLRKNRQPLLALPVAIALWWALFHTDQAIGPAWESLGYQRWIVIANSLAVLGVAESVERWQRRQRSERGADAGDFAGAFWLVGMLGFAISYLSLWGRLDAGKHTLALVATGVVTLAVVLKRKVVFAFGLVGVGGYLAFLAEDVFETGVAFPLVLAAIGLATIAVTIWLQKRHPGLLALGHDGASSKPLPWSRPIAWLPMAFAAAMALLALTDAAEERAQRDFMQRFTILRGHSGSMRRRSGPAPSGDSVRTSAADSNRAAEPNPPTRTPQAAPKP